MSNVEKPKALCQHCGKEFIKIQKRKRFCSSTCLSRNYHSKDTWSKIPLSTGKIGAIAELLVSVDLMLRGFDVFRALSPSSDADIIAEKSGILYKFEVRTGRYLKSGKIACPTYKTKNKSLVVFTFSDRKVHYISNPEIRDIVLTPQ